jgi:hypothetical protein
VFLAQLLLSLGMNDFKEFLVSKRVIPEKRVPFYLLWVRRFQEYAKKGAGGDFSEREVKAFVKGLEKDYEEWQVKQAREAVDRGLRIMTDQSLRYIGATLTLLWGIAHLFATKSVVRAFGDISIDNRHIITMEWLIEGVALIFIGLLVATVTLIDSASPAAKAVYLLSVVALIALAVISLFTGFRVSFLPFKLCPIIFSFSAALILAGSIFL